MILKLMVLQQTMRQEQARKAGGAGSGRADFSLRRRAIGGF